MQDLLQLLLPVLSLLASISCLIWLGIYFYKPRLWDLHPRDDLPTKIEKQEQWPDVAIVVPARNEAEALPLTLPCLLNQNYPGRFQVVLVDDRSTDRTAEIALELARSAAKENNLAVVSGQALPEGWVGKVWAMEQGTRFLEKELEKPSNIYANADIKAQTFSPRYLLLTDADIRHEQDSLLKLVLESEANELALNSRMALLRCVSPAERLLIPPFLFFFNLMYPMRRINDPHDRLAGAAGGCVLLHKNALQLAGGFSAIRTCLIDDVNLAKAIKALGKPIRLAVSCGTVTSLRAYESLGSIWKMVRRSAFTELQYSWLRLMACMFILVLMYLLPYLTIAGGLGLLASGELFISTPYNRLGWMLLCKGLLAYGLMCWIYLPSVRFFGLSRLWSLTLPLAGIMYGGMTLDSALQHTFRGGPHWR